MTPEEVLDLILLMPDNRQYAFLRKDILKEYYAQEKGVRQKYSQGRTLPSRREKGQGKGFFTSPSDDQMAQIWNLSNDDNSDVETGFSSSPDRSSPSHTSEVTSEETNDIEEDDGWL